MNISLREHEPVPETIRLGSDTDEKFAGRPLAQTNIVLTIDPASRTVGMLSIPRDFFLNVPGYGMPSRLPRRPV